MWDHISLRDAWNDPEGRRLLRLADWGIEREAQRVTPSGDLALTEHPAAFGNKLTNPRITTDFAESQLELITSPHPTLEEAFGELARIHDEVEAGLNGEYLWPLSMPPRLPEEDLIPIARYDDTPEGRASRAYRESLAERYGKKMQMISGLHVNFSLKEELFPYLSGRLGLSEDQTTALRSELYLALARNFLRHRWLLVYLFGTSPAIDPSYDSVVCDELSVIEQCCPDCCPSIGQYEKYATSLRVSRYGYANTEQKDVSVSFNSLQEHVDSFHRLLRTSIRKESEFYCSIRMKPRMARGQRYVDALETNGVQYAEVRIIDLNPTVREGIHIDQLRFLHLFLLWCLLEPSPPMVQGECRQANENHHLVSLFGRKPGLKLHHYGSGEAIAMTEWMESIFRELRELASDLDRDLQLESEDRSEYQKVIEQYAVMASDASRIPSARMIEEMKRNGWNLIQYGMHHALCNHSLNRVNCV